MTQLDHREDNTEERNQCTVGATSVLGNDEHVANPFGDNYDIESASNPAVFERRRRGGGSVCTPPTRRLLQNSRRAIRARQVPNRIRVSIRGQGWATSGSGSAGSSRSGEGEGMAG